MKTVFVVLLAVLIPQIGFNQNNTLYFDTPNPELLIEINGVTAPGKPHSFINYPAGDYTIKLTLPEQNLSTLIKLQLTENDSVVIRANLPKAEVFPVFYKNFNDPGHAVSTAKKLFFIVETMPVFKPDPNALAQYIETQVALEKQQLGISKKGKLFVQFTINEQGNVSTTHIVKGVDPELDLTAQKIIWNMPQWESPGMLRGKPVRVAFTIPVIF